MIGALVLLFKKACNLVTEVIREKHCTGTDSAPGATVKSVRKATCSSDLKVFNNLTTARLDEITLCPLCSLARLKIA